MERGSAKKRKNWLLAFYIGFPGVIIAAIVAVTWNIFTTWFSKEEERPSSESKSEGSTHTYTSRSRSESISQTDTSRSKSEESTNTQNSSD
ncbi:disintegrin and metalloproteinase domain-containing protein 32-like [Tupaia chinensis]|uniref:disintegrin and metalloproteinase domain-containing protein 32-like n=1 Tax=Tupaia chinensis TaxID=246437 RepID=UPI0003C913B3|nr:disintegrin and metalloproteinase domain-containing protein 32-like [Tupaia chinensis]